MNRPPISEAPDRWLEETVENCAANRTDEFVRFVVIASEDGKHHWFTFTVGEVRAELRRRAAS